MISRPIDKKKMPIAAEGLKIIIPLVVFAVFMFILKWNSAGSIFLLIAILITFFFRDPRRKVSAGDNIVVSPADGKIVAIKDTFENDYLRQPVKQISIFLSIFDVHVNRVPISGKIESVKYHPGKFHIAALEKASLENENSAMVISDGKTKILVKQIAGIIARRIACYVKAGDKVKMGERYGLIYFGSRVDIFLPKNSEIKVKMGDKVKGLINIIALLR